MASLNDTHDRFTLPSDFAARLPMTVDVYDGKVLVETITRSLLPQNAFPFAIGDELVSVDGAEVEQLLKDFAKYATYANPIATRRLAAARITSRIQALMPHAPEVGETATIVVRRQNGNLETYSIPWQKTGTPLEVGPVPAPKTQARIRAAAALSNPENPDYMRLLDEVSYSGVGVAGSLTGVLNLGARSPVVLAGLPATFTRRLGGSAGDFFYSGTFKYEELTLGYIRIPNYGPPSQSLAIQQFQREIDFMNANTDGLIVDEMRNTGGNLCFGEELASRLIPYPFQATGFQLRAFWTRLLGFYNQMINAKAQGAPPDVISTADSVASMIQDAGRGMLYGMRTNGAGGNNTIFDAGPFSEGLTGMTIGLQTRKAPVATPDYPATIYIENVGVRPEVIRDYMTRDNLLQSGAPFIRDFLESMAAYVRGGGS